MNLSCSSRMIKYLMFAFNLFFVISGIIIIAVGATVKAVYSDYSLFLDSKYFTLPNMLIATGALIFVVSFFGCCGAFKESWIMLGVFTIFLCIIFIFEFSAGIAGYVLRDKTIEYLDKTMMNNLENYNTSTYNIWDLIQSNFHCCGVDSFDDWKQTFPSLDLPVSCCPMETGIVGVFYCNGYTTTTTQGTTPSISSSTETTTATTSSSITTAPATNTTSATTTTSASTTSEITNTTISSPTTHSPTSVGSQSDRRKRYADNQPSTVKSTTIIVSPSPSTSTPYQTGCKAAFGKYIKTHAVQIGGCALGLAIIQIMGIAFSVHLVRQLKNGYYST